jgi:DNA-binding NtrC family response regulator
MRFADEGVVREVAMNTMGSSTGAVLIIDDDRDCSDSIRAVLERNGYEVESADHVDAAVEALSTGKFDLVFCDYRMPEKTGIDLLREVRRQGWDVPVVMISAHLDPVAEQDARALGAARFINKPLRRREVLEAASHF